MHCVPKRIQEEKKMKNHDRRVHKEPFITFRMWKDVKISTEYQEPHGDTYKKYQIFLDHLKVFGRSLKSFQRKFQTLTMLTMLTMLFTAVKYLNSYNLYIVDK